MLPLIRLISFYITISMASLFLRGQSSCLSYSNLFLNRCVPWSLFYSVLLINASILKILETCQSKILANLNMNTTKSIFEFQVTEYKVRIGIKWCSSVHALKLTHPPCWMMQSAASSSRKRNPRCNRVDNAWPSLCKAWSRTKGTST